MSTASSPRADESRSTPSPKRQKISPVTVSQVRVQPQPCISTLSADKPKQRGGRVQPLSRRATLNADKRAIVVDWLMELQRKLRIHPESLFLAVSILDRVNLHPSRLDIHDVASQTKREIVVKNARMKSTGYQKAYITERDTRDRTAEEKSEIQLVCDAAACISVASKYHRSEESSGCMHHQHHFLTLIRPASSAE